MLIIEHWGAVESDMSTYHRVAEPLTLPWRRFSTLVRHFPPEGAFLRALAPLLLKGRSDPISGGDAPGRDGDRSDAPEWLREYNRLQKIEATYVDMDYLRGGELPEGGERRVS